MTLTVLQKRSAAARKGARTRKAMKCTREDVSRETDNEAIRACLDCGGVFPVRKAGRPGCPPLRCKPCQCERCRMLAAIWYAAKRQNNNAWRRKNIARAKAWREKNAERVRQYKLEYKLAVAA